MHPKKNKTTQKIPQAFFSHYNKLPLRGFDKSLNVRKLPQCFGHLLRVDLPSSIGTLVTRRACLGMVQVIEPTYQLFIRAYRKDKVNIVADGIFSGIMVHPSSST